jgi:hypothetical protein
MSGGVRFRAPRGTNSGVLSLSTLRPVVARPCTRCCGSEATETIPFPGAESIFSSCCGAISGQLRLAVRSSPAAILATVIIVIPVDHRPAHPGDLQLKQAKWVAPAASSIVAVAPRRNSANRRDHETLKTFQTCLISARKNDEKNTNIDLGFQKDNAAAILKTTTEGRLARFYFD